MNTSGNNQPIASPRPKADPMETAYELYNAYEFNMIPIERPGGTSHGKNPLRGFKWKEYQYTKIDEEYLVSLFDEHSGKRNWCNWAVVCGEVSDCVVFDCDDEAAIAWGRKHLPATPFVIKTGKGKHFYYRYPKGQTEWLKTLNDLRKKWGVNVDIQRDEKYVIAPGSVHETGKVYSWATDDEWFMGEFPDWQIVPEFQLLNMEGVEASSSSMAATSQCSAPAPAPIAASGSPTPENLYRDFGIDMSDSDGVDFDESVKEGGRNNRLTAIIGKFISENPDEEPAKVYEFAYGWNAEHCIPPLEHSEVQRTVASILRAEKNKKKAEKIGGGFRNAAAAEQATDMSDVEIVKEDALRSSLCTKIPDILLNPPGRLGVLQRYIMDSNVRTTRMFATVGAIAIMSTAMGYKIKTQTGLVANNYLVCVGSSSCGKNAPKSAVISLLSKYAPKCFGGNDVASDAALVNRIAADGRHESCFVFDEIGLFLQSCKNPTSAKAGVAKALTELYSNPETGYEKVYADQEMNKSTGWQSTTILGMSVPGEVFKALGGGSATNGFMARMNFFIEPGDQRLEKKFDILREIPPEVDKVMRELFPNPDMPNPNIWYTEQDMSIPPEKRSLDDIASNRKPVPCPSLFTPETKAYLKEMDYNYYDKLQHDKEADGDAMDASIYGRAVENALKFALVLHFNQHCWPTKGPAFGEYIYPPMEKQTLEQAFEIIGFTTKGTIETATYSIADSRYEEGLNMFLKVIDQSVRKSMQNAKTRGCPDNYCPGAEYKKIQKAMKGFSTLEVAEFRDKLVSSNQIRLVDWTDQRGRKKEVYARVQPKDGSEE